MGSKPSQIKGQPVTNLKKDSKPSQIKGKAVTTSRTNSKPAQIKEQTVTNIRKDTKTSQIKQQAVTNSRTDSKPSQIKEQAVTNTRTDLKPYQIKEQAMTNSRTDSKPSQKKEQAVTNMKKDSEPSQIKQQTVTNLNMDSKPSQIKDQAVANLSMDTKPSQIKEQEVTNLSMDSKSSQIKEQVVSTAVETFHTTAKKVEEKQKDDEPNSSDSYDVKSNSMNEKEGNVEVGYNQMAFAENKEREPYDVEKNENINEDDESEEGECQEDDNEEEDNYDTDNSYSLSAEELGVHLPDNYASNFESEMVEDTDFCDDVNDSDLEDADSCDNVEDSNIEDADSCDNVKDSNIEDSDSCNNEWYDLEIESRIAAINMMDVKRRVILKESVKNTSFLLHSKDNHKGLLSDEQMQAISKIVNAFYRIKDEYYDLTEFAMDDVASKTKEYYTTEIVCKYSERYFKKTDSDKVHSALRLLTKYLLNVTNHSVYACRLIINQAAFLRSAMLKIEQWQEPSISGEMKDEENIVLTAILGMFDNLSMVEDIAIQLKERNFFELIKPYLQVTDKSIRISALAILSSIADEKEIDTVSAEGDIEFLINNLRRAVFEELRSKTVMRKLCRNESNKVRLTDTGLIDVLVKLIKKIVCRPNATSYAIRTLLALSFNDTVAETMANSKDVVTLLYENMDPDEVEYAVFWEDEEDIPRQILWNIRDKLVNSKYSNIQEIGQKVLKSIPPDDVREKGNSSNKDDDKKDDHSSSKRGHIMISYNRCHRDLASKISKEIKRNGYKVWIDYDNMHGSTIEAMSSAVENADIVFMCLSPQYKKSPNCRSEAMYAHKREKKIFHLKMDSKYDPDGWLGMLLSDNKFYDFGGKYPFEAKIDELMKAIEYHYQSTKK